MKIVKSGLDIAMKCSKVVKDTKRQANKLKELQSIKYIGPKYAEILWKQDIKTKNSLKNFYIDECKKDSSKFISKCQGFGIKNTAHLQHVASYLTSVTEANPVRIAIEGNIGAGKSTFLNMMQRASQNKAERWPRLDLDIFQEPVQEWQSLPGVKINDTDKDQTFNLLDLHYQNPELWGSSLQTLVLVTRSRQLRQSQSTQKNQVLLERSPFSDRMVFAKSLYRKANMHGAQLAIYDQTWRELMQNLDSLIPDGFVYLSATSDTCMSRMKIRNRCEESGVSLEYLEELHQNHETWLNSPQSYNSKTPEQWTDNIEKQLRSQNSKIPYLGQYQVHCPEQICQKDLIIPTLPTVPQSIKSKVALLDSSIEWLPDIINCKPTLIINYDEVDISDEEHQIQLAMQLRDYFDWCSQYRQVLRDVVKVDHLFHNKAKPALRLA